MKSDAAQVVPPSLVVAAAVTGFTWQDWASIAAIILIAAQFAYLVWKWHMEWKARQVK